MLFGSTIKISKNTDNFKVQINSDVLDQENSFKYLGVYLDPILFWKGHLTHARNSFNRKIRLFYSFLKGDTLNTMYQSLVVPSLEYCVVWGNAAIKHFNVNRLFPTKSMLDCLEGKLYIPDGKHISTS